MGNHIQNQKNTYICPIEGCTYTSRKWNSETLTRERYLSVKNSVWSCTCPIHQKELVKAAEIRLPKRKSAKFKRFIKKLKK